MTYILIYESTHWKWYTTPDFYAAHQAELEAHYTYPETFLARLAADFGYYPIAGKISLYIDGGGTGLWASTSGGNTVSVGGDTFTYAYRSIDHYYFLLFTLHETINIMTGVVAVNWPWADGSSLWSGSSAFPSAMDIVVLDEIGQTDLSNYQLGDMSSDDACILLYNLQQNYGWAIYRDMIQYIINFGIVDFSIYDEPLRTSILVYFLSYASETALISQFQTAGIAITTDSYEAAEALFPMSSNPPAESECYIVGPSGNLIIYKASAVGTPKSIALTVTLKKAADDTPIVGATIAFTTSLGTVDPASDVTDGTGEAHTTLTSADVIGWAVVKAAFAGDESYSATNGYVEVGIYAEEPVPDATKPYQVFVHGIEYPYVSGTYTRSAQFTTQIFTLELAKVEADITGAFEVQIFRRGTLDFIGRLLKPKKTVEDRMILTGLSNHWKLLRRLANLEFTTTDPGTIISTLLTRYPCGVGIGAISAFGANVPLPFSYDNLLRAIQRVQNATGFFLRLNLDDTLDYAATFGSVKPVSFESGSDISGLEAEDDYSRITTRSILIGQSDTLVSDKSDATALANAGLIEEVFYDKNVTSQVTLDYENQSILAGRLTLAARYSGTVIDQNYAVSDYDIFDYVTVTDTVTGLSGNYRVAQITRDLTDPGSSYINLSSVALDFQSVLTSLDTTVKDISASPGEDTGIGLPDAEGDMIYADAAPAWAKLPIGIDGKVLKVVDGLPSWEDEAGGDLHALLSATHTDTLAASVLAGDLIYGNATPKWARLAKAADGRFLSLVSGFPSWTYSPITGAILTGASSSAWTVLPPGASGDVLTISGGTPIWAAPSISGLTGGGTINYLAKWTGATSLGNAPGLLQDPGISGSPYRATTSYWRFETMPMQFMNSSSSAPSPLPSLYFTNLYRRQDTKAAYAGRLMETAPDGIERTLVNTEGNGRWGCAPYWAKEADYASTTHTSTLSYSANLVRNDSDDWSYKGTELNTTVSPPFASAYLINPVTIGSAVLSVLAFDGEMWDTDGMFTPGDTKMYARRLSGYYLIQASACYDVNATGFRICFTRKNGSQVTVVDEAVGGALAGVQTVVKSSKVYYMNVGDYVEMQIYQNSGGNLQVIGPEDLTWLSITYLGA